jgi:undecaprenyl-diphosphatase
MSLIHVIALAIVQGLAELLPVSSSAHVVVAEKLMGLDPSSPPMTLLLVMLHTGTMFAVIVYFWQKWRQTYFQDSATTMSFVKRVILATVLTGIVGEATIKVIEKTAFRKAPHAQIEDLFSHLELIAPALAVAGLLILIAGLLERRSSNGQLADANELKINQASVIGAVQGLCLPFRGLSRSGATISTGMLVGVDKAGAENFSFALAVVLTPAAVARELMRLAQSGDAAHALTSAMLPSLLGMVFAFLAGLIALRWLGSWLERGRWYLFGIYCLAAAGAVATLHWRGY